MVIGSLIIQQRMGASDQDLVKQIQENPYYQYFIGLESFQHTPLLHRPCLWNGENESMFPSSSGFMM